MLRLTTSSISIDKLIKGQLHFLSNYYEIVGVASDDGTLESVGKREGIRVVNLPMTRDINVIKDIWSFIKMVKLIKNEKPDIIHCNTPKASLLGMTAGWLCNVPKRIYTVTGLRFEGETGFLRNLLRFMERITCAFATNVIPEGQGVKKTLYTEKITKKSLNVIHYGNINGIDTSHFSNSIFTDFEKNDLRKSLNISLDDFVFVYVGRLVRDKGINELVSAFGKIKNEGFRMKNEKSFNNQSPISCQQKYIKENCKLLLVGPLEEELDPLQPNTLHEIKNNPDIISVGWQDDVRPYLAISDALVFPSYREGFPNVVMQAGAMDLPSIVTNINGSNEIIVQGENGVIIPSKNEKKLLEAMQFFLQNEAEVKRMAKNSRKMIVERYEQQVVWNALLEEYQRLEREYQEKIHK